MNIISKSEQKQLIEGLNRLKPGFLPAEIFYAISRLMVTTTYTIVPLFMDDKLYVHLTHREGNDPHWAGLLQTPGKVILSTDKTIDETYSRLYHDELKSTPIIKGPIFCGYVFEEIPRGKEIAIINYILLESKPDFGELHNVINLPRNLIKTENKRIKMAVEKFIKN